MMLKAVVLLSVISVAYGCNTAVVNAIIAAISGSINPTTVKPTVKPTEPTVKPTEPPVTGSPSCKCGIPNRGTKIVNGEETEQNEYPWQVGLTKGIGWSPSCGGSIISEKSILTAAHCTVNKSPSDIWILVGAHSMYELTVDMYVPVCAINDHPGYNDNTYDNDYSVLTLCEPLVFKKEIMPVCLPDITDTDASYENLASIVTGWGTIYSDGPTSEVLLEVTVNTMPNTKCCNQVDYFYSCLGITSNMLCAYAPQKDSCQGDSGGPLITMKDGKYVQSGVVSFGKGCAATGYPGVYARTTSALEWIMSKMMGNTCY